MFLTEQLIRPLRELTVTSISTPYLIRFSDQKQQAYGLLELISLVQQVQLVLLGLLDRKELQVILDLLVLLVPLALLVQLVLSEQLDR